MLGEGYGDDFKLSIPGDQAGARNLSEIAGEIANRMISIFTRNEHGERPVCEPSSRKRVSPIL